MRSLVADIQLGSRDIWLFNLSHDQPSLFTFDPMHKTNPTWSPDGAWIAFSSYQQGNLDIYRKASAGTGKAEPLLEITYIADPKTAYISRDDHKNRRRFAQTESQLEKRGNSCDSLIRSVQAR